MFSVSVFFILSLLLLRVIYYRYKYLSHLSKFKSPKGWPLIGSVLEFMDPREVLEKGLKYRKELGDNFLVYIPLNEGVIVTEPKLCEYVLGSAKFNDKSDDYNLLKRWFGEGLLTSNGYKWKSHRKVITPSFHYKILEDFVEIFDKCSKVLIQKLEKEIGNDSFDIFNYVSLYTLDIICEISIYYRHFFLETAMGTSVNAQDNPKANYVQSIKGLCRLMNQRFFSIILRIDLIYFFTSSYETEKKLLKVVKGYSRDVIQKRKIFLKNKQLHKSDESNEDLNEFGVRIKTSFLDTLFQCSIDGVPLTEEEIQEEVDTFIFEGHDTTAGAISFTLYSLSKNLNIQEKVYKEIIAVLGDNKEVPVTYDKLQKMKYLEMVIKESLRLYPSVPGFFRIVKEDFEFDGKIFPKGLTITISPYAMHRNPNIYPDPDKFDPERFNFENSKNRHPYSFVPFSAGARNCIGQKFAMLELKSTISKVLKYFKVMPAIPEHNPLLISELTMLSYNGIKIRLEKRK